MNKYGVILSYIGFSLFFDHLLERYINPLSNSLFKHIGGGTLDSHHAFTVEYRAGGGEGETNLGFHVDDSEVTLNVCCGDNFQQGGLYFRGQRCNVHVNSNPNCTESFDYEHENSMGILHAGRHRHGARAITSGRRVNLIVWCRSSKMRAACMQIGSNNATCDLDENGYTHSSFVGETCAPWCGLWALHEGDCRNAYKPI